MYRLTLSAEERRAIDWIGWRYAHGVYLYRLLWANCDQSPNDVDWDSEGDITFHVPESIAWQINKVGEACDYHWDCFGPELSAKLTSFCMAIV